MEILGGLASGQRVVTSAQFLIDSESNVAEVMRSMNRCARARGHNVRHYARGHERGRCKRGRHARNAGNITSCKEVGAHAQSNHRLVDLSYASGSVGHNCYVGRRFLGHAQHSRGRDSRLVRRAGHSNDAVARPGTAGRRGPDHLSPGDGAAQGSAHKVRARDEPVRFVGGLRCVRGRHRSVLGAEQSARVHERRARQASEWCAANAWARCQPELVG